MKRASCPRLVLLGLISFCLSSAVPGAAQIPDEFTNLELLDSAIEKPQLLGVMKSWARGLGVRCNHCHVGPDNLQGMDFASDEKASKRTARRMLLMTRAINGELLSDLPIVAESDREGSQVVSCYSCHRGMSRPPRHIDAELGTVAREQGPEAALSRYHELVTAHENRGQYDLRPAVLLDLANSFLEGKDSEGARKVVEELLEMTPESAPAYATLSRIELVSGQLDAAQEAVTRALAIDPEDPMAGWMNREVEKARAAQAEQEKADQPEEAKDSGDSER